MSSHFDDRDALAHVIEKRVEGMLSTAESHGTEMPGHISAGADSARETALVLLMIWTILSFLNVTFSLMWSVFVAFSLGWLGWKTGRSAWLGWARLERLHRIIEQEKYEIEHHRVQERQELSALYRAKGFEGKLLEDVIDVLMAVQDRLLKVMLEEELGLTHQAYEHPLKQAVGAFVGTFVSACVTGVLFFLFPAYGMLIAPFFIISVAAALSAVYEQNRIIPALIWNLSIALLGAGTSYFVLKIFL